MCNLHWCYTFCTGVTLFALVLHLNCTALSQSESSNFFMYIINFIIENSILHIFLIIILIIRCSGVFHVAGFTGISSRAKKSDLTNFHALRVTQHRLPFKSPVNLNNTALGCTPVLNRL